eukprot:gene15739-biopygen2428
MRLHPTPLPPLGSRANRGGKLLKAACGDASSCPRLFGEAAHAGQGCSKRLLKLPKAARAGSSWRSLLEDAAQAARDYSRKLLQLLKVVIPNAARAGCSNCSRLLEEAAHAGQGCSRRPCRT